jgi:molybdopterin-binding protein
MTGDFLTVRDAARRIGVSYSTLKQWIYKGSVRTMRTDGGHHRVPQGEVDRLMARSGAPAPKAAVSEVEHGVLVALSGRNQLRGIVDEVRAEGLIVQIRLRIGTQRLTAVITRDAQDELALERGDEAVAIIKSTEVMIGREQSRRPTPRLRAKRTSDRRRSRA